MAAVMLRQHSPGMVFRGVCCPTIVARHTPGGLHTVRSVEFEWCLTHHQSHLCGVARFCGRLPEITASAISVVYVQAVPSGETESQPRGLELGTEVFGTPLTMRNQLEGTTFPSR